MDVRERNQAPQKAPLVPEQIDGLQMAFDIHSRVLGSARDVKYEIEHVSCNIRQD
jgi:hypothetical protein